MADYPCRLILVLYATGTYTLAHLEATMADLGLTSRRTVKPLTDSTLHERLSDPYYLGYVVYKGEIYQGRHEPIVGQELFDQVQDVLNARSAAGQRDRVHQHHLKGGLFCGRCHRTGRTARLIYTEVTGRGGRYGYFVCRGRQEGLCDLPYLRAEAVEDAIVEYYRELQLPDTFITDVRALLETTLGNEQAATRTMHQSLQRKLKELDTHENRLLDLATLDTMPTAKIRAKLLHISAERERVNARLATTGAELGIGAGVLRDALHLLTNPYQLYADAKNPARRHLNQTFFERFYLDDTRVVEDQKTPLFQELAEAKAVHQQRQTTTGTGIGKINERANHTRTPSHRNARSPRDAEASSVHPKSPTLAGVLTDAGSSKAAMVGVTGFEPATTRSQSGCATKLRYTPLRGGRRPLPERATGIEPAPSAWKAEVLPLNYARTHTTSMGSPLCRLRLGLYRTSLRKRQSTAPGVPGRPPHRTPLRHGVAARRSRGPVSAPLLGR
ncbi:hypothetical protein GCM10027089_14650 [Nocardia thraciensis]